MALASNRESVHGSDTCSNLRSMKEDAWIQMPHRDRNLRAVLIDIAIRDLPGVVVENQS